MGQRQQAVMVDTPYGPEIARYGKERACTKSVKYFTGRKQMAVHSGVTQSNRRCALKGFNFRGTTVDAANGARRLPRRDAGCLSQMMTENLY